MREIYYQPGGRYKDDLEIGERRGGNAKSRKKGRE